jgi:hypothetical protein
VVPMRRCPYFPIRIERVCNGANECDIMCKGTVSNRNDGSGIMLSWCILFRTGTECVELGLFGFSILLCNDSGSDSMASIDAEDGLPDYYGKAYVICLVFTCFRSCSSFCRSCSDLGLFAGEPAHV